MPGSGELAFEWAFELLLDLRPNLEVVEAGDVLVFGASVSCLFHSQDLYAGKEERFHVLTRRLGSCQSGPCLRVSYSPLLSSSIVLLAQLFDANFHTVLGEYYVLLLHVVHASLCELV